MGIVGTKVDIAVGQQGLSGGREVVGADDVVVAVVHPGRVSVSPDAPRVAVAALEVELAVRGAVACRGVVGVHVGVVLVDDPHDAVVAGHAAGTVVGAGEIDVGGGNVAEVAVVGDVVGIQPHVVPVGDPQGRSLGPHARRVAVGAVGEAAGGSATAVGTLVTEAAIVVIVDHPQLVAPSRHARGIVVVKILVAARRQIETLGRLRRPYRGIQRCVRNQCCCSRIQRAAKQDTQRRRPDESSPLRPVLGHTPAPETGERAARRGRR